MRYLQPVLMLGSSLDRVLADDVDPRWLPPQRTQDVGSESALGRASDTRRMLKFDIAIAQASVTKYRARPSQPPSQTWRTFLGNQIAQITAFAAPKLTRRRTLTDYTLNV
jgi:hypothetical protein